jgi:DNA-binding PadR family transcriptional regulator
MSHCYLMGGLLAEQPMTGYDMRKHIVLYAVTRASYGTFYPTLHKLMEEGTVQEEDIEQDARPPKKLYPKRA